jgi:hypothetical protein
MTQLKRKPAAESRAASNPRYLAPGEEIVAKQQAYILRDLIRQHCGITLSGGDVTDCFSIVYHGMDWATLIANQRGKSSATYYGAGARDVVHQQAHTLRDLIGPCAGVPVRALLDMPKAAYQQPRTMAGAKLCTLLAGAPSWTLYDASSGNGSDRPLVYDADADKGYIPKHFNSDPMTNAERLCAVDPKTGEEVIIPIERVRFVRLQRPEGEQKTDYVLAEHARSLDAAKAFYPQALSYSLARRWFNAGNDLYVMVFHAGTKTTRCQLGEWTKDVAQWDFDRAMDVLREFYPGCNVVMTPRGLDQVRDPAERWAPSFKHVNAILPEVEAADGRYQTFLDGLHTLTNIEAEAGFRQATRNYNEVLLRALDAFWRDTREINSRSTLFQSFGTPDVEERLAIAQYGPLQKLREMIGLDAKGNPKKPQAESVDPSAPEVMERRIGGWS